jgi:hypothetical protein
MYLSETKESATIVERHLLEETNASASIAERFFFPSAPQS